MAQFQRRHRDDRRGLGDRLLDVFQRQIELIRMQLGQPLVLGLRSPAPCATACEASRSSRSADPARQSLHRARRWRSTPMPAAHQCHRERKSTGFVATRNPDRSGRDQHCATHAVKRRTARNTASTSRLLVPPDTRTLMTHRYYGHKARISSAGSAKQPSLLP